MRRNIQSNKKMKARGVLQCYFLKINVEDAIVVRSRFTAYAFHDSGELVLLGGPGRCRVAGWCVFLFW